MANMKRVESAVMAVLTAHPDARNDDFILINMVYQHLKFETGSTYFEDVMMSHKKHNLPSFESITRARRKLQAEYPHLRADKLTQNVRDKQQEEFRQYALELD